MNKCIKELRHVNLMNIKYSFLICNLFMSPFISVSLAVGFDLDSCNCKQCRHVSVVRDRCECCVFLLHGKRSASTRNTTPNHKASPSEIRSKRKYSSFILDVVNPFGVQRKSSEPKTPSSNRWMSFDTVNIPHHLKAFMMMENRHRALDNPDIDDNVISDFERKNRFKDLFGYKLKAIEPFYFQYKPAAENQIQAGDDPAIRPLNGFSYDYDFENGDDFNDFFEPDNVEDIAEIPGDPSRL